MAIIKTAILQTHVYTCLLYTSGHNFFVFFNAETEQVNVVYKRKGNTYGLIEPEF